jgi:hypothetical protein
MSCSFDRLPTQSSRSSRFFPRWCWTSHDPYAVRLIQAHAEVVSAFIANGRSEMMKNHPVPARQQP